jgi:hypothetical protein
MITKKILDDTEQFLRRHIIYPDDYSSAANTAWVAGSYFLKYNDLPVFDNYPILAFLSPEEDNGKTRALTVTGLLCENSMPGGSHTAASLCREIDKHESRGELIAIILDEVDEIFSHNKDAGDYIRLFNNGYERGSCITRASLSSKKENIRTNSYCPKAIAGLAANHLKRTTRSRMIVIRMRPKKPDETVERHIDVRVGRELNNQLRAWAPTIVDELKDIDEDALSKLCNRRSQLWHPLLAIAYLAGEEWFNKLSDASTFFATQQKPEEGLGKLILCQLYDRFVNSRQGSTKGIWTETFHDHLMREGLLSEKEKFRISWYLGQTGYGIPTKDLRMGSEVKKGYYWDDCKSTFEDFLTEEEKEGMKRLV